MHASGEHNGKQDTTLDLTESGFRKQRRLKYADYGLIIINKVKDDLESKENLYMKKENC